MDLWEANSVSFALTPHPCSENKYFVCEKDTCGGTYSEERYTGKARHTPHPTIPPTSSPV